MEKFRQLMGKTMLTLLSAALLYGLGGWQVVQGQNHPNGYDFIGPDGIKYPDFTFAGYKHSQEPIPDLPVVATMRQGTGNDRQALIDAINAAIAVGGGTVYIPAGNYTFSEGVRIQPNDAPIVIRGAGQGRTILNWTAGRDNAAIWFLGGREYDVRILENSNWQEGQRAIDLPAGDADSQWFLDRTTPGDWIRLQSHVLPTWVKGRFQSDINGGEFGPGDKPFIVNIFKVDSISGNTLYLDQPLRGFHSYTRIGRARGAVVPRAGYIEDCGIENLTMSFAAGMYDAGQRLISIRFDNSVNCWARNITINETSRSPMSAENSKCVTFQNFTINGTQNSTSGGGFAYVGVHLSFDCLFEDMVGNELRHAPNTQYYASGNVFRNIDFQDCNTESHFTFARYNLYENVRIRSTRFQTETYRTSAIGEDYYGRAPSGSGEVIYNCDYDKGERGGSLFFGGLLRDNVVAHSRFISPGNTWRVSNWFEADDIIIADFCENLTIKNNVFVNKDEDSYAQHLVFLPGFVVGQGQSGADDCFNPRIGPDKYYGAKVSGCVPNTSTVHLIDNKFYGLPSSRRILSDYGRLATDQSNQYFTNLDLANIPARPTAPVPSIWEWQRQNKAAQSGRGSTFPVELIQFDAEGMGSYIYLKWETASEQNSSHFDLQRSLDGSSFESLGRVNSHQNSDTGHAYDFEDVTALPNVSYLYRLKMVDLDGSFEYSSVVQARLNGEAELKMEVYPNPSQGLINLELQTMTEESFEIRVVDLLGKTVSQREIPSSLGRSIVTLNLSHLNKGMYLLAVVDQYGEQRGYKKFVLN